MMIRLLLLCALVMSFVGIAFPASSMGQSGELQLGAHTIRANDTTLRLARNAGFSWIVQLLEWREIAPAPERRLWEYADWLVQACEYYGLNLALRLDHPPDWAQTLADDDNPISLQAYLAFVDEIARRYQHRVQAYIIWNEPNLSTEWGGRPPNPAAYSNMLIHAYETVKTIDPAVKVVSAGLAPTNENSRQAMDDRLYLQLMYDHGVLGHFDALGAHPYGFAYPPDDPAGDHDSLNFARLSETRRIMERNGDAAAPVWATEVGWITTPAPESKLWQQVTPHDQAKYLVGAFELAKRDWPWLHLLAVWNLSAVADQPDITGYSICGDGYTPRPAYQALAAMPKPAQTFRPKRPACLDHVQVLAPDVIVHLGDTVHVNPGWSPLHCETAPCRQWTGHFYIPSPLGMESSIWEQHTGIRIEIMQVEELGNLLQINGKPLVPQTIPRRVRPDFATAWTTVDVHIPPGTLVTGQNTIEIRSSPRLPPYHGGVRFESLQVRNIRVVFPEPITASWP